ncbi:MAG: hypothetical protein MSG64_11970 [Pyrinomonadaceae bacterium MAG19_C2-C3]|nr:hypothetical protein [Pyrinomonadaceae bacterium MAG19_C2-C3]
MKNKFRLMTILAATAITPLVLPAVSPSGQFAVVAQTADEEKTKLYTDFYNAVTGNGNVVNDAAYQIGKQYLAKYGTQTDQYTQYIKAQVEAYEKSQKTAVYVKLFVELDKIYNKNSKTYATAFTEGRGILASKPNDLNVLLNLARVGYLANANNDKQFNAEATGYTTKALQLFESGAEPTDLNPDNNDTGERYYPFNKKQDAEAFLHFALGDFTLAASPREAARHYVKAASYDSYLKKEPSTYVNLASAYALDYDRLSADFKRIYGGQDESEASKAALANLNQVIDRIIDAQARVVTYSGTDPKYQAYKTPAQTQLTQFYQFRNNNETTGLPEYIAGVTNKPLPEPVTVTINAPPTAPTTTDGTSVTPTTPTNGATPTATPVATPAATPSATPRPNATPATRPRT